MSHVDENSSDVLNEVFDFKELKYQALYVHLISVHGFIIEFVLNCLFSIVYVFNG